MFRIMVAVLCATCVFAATDEKQCQLERSQTFGSGLTIQEVLSNNRLDPNDPRILGKLSDDLTIYEIGAGQFFVSFVQGDRTIEGILSNWNYDEENGEITFTLNIAFQDSGSRTILDFEVDRPFFGRIYIVNSSIAVALQLDQRFITHKAQNNFPAVRFVRNLFSNSATVQICKCCNDSTGSGTCPVDRDCDNQIVGCRHNGNEQTSPNASCLYQTTGGTGSCMALFLMPAMLLVRKR